MPVSSALLDRVARVLAETALTPDDALVVGFSGGVDSLSLLMLLAALYSAGRGPRPHAVHVDHGLRLESRDDAQRALALAVALQVQPALMEVDVTSWSSGGVEAAARDARYAALAAVAVRLGTTWIALGHTRNDQAETVLLHLLRGAGLGGLTGMREVSHRVIQPAPGAVGVEFGLLRPLLGVRRGELVDLVAGSGLIPVEDPSNADPRYRRNRVRRELLPLAEEIAPGAVETIARAADLLSDDATYLDLLARHRLPDVGVADNGLVRISRAHFELLPAALRGRVLRLALGDIATSFGEPSRERLAALETALLRGARATIELGAGLAARIDAEGAVLGEPDRIVATIRRASGLPLLRPRPDGSFGDFSVALAGQSRLPLANGWELCLRAPSGWTLRRRRAGDRLQAPDGSTRRLQDWLVNRKVPAEARDGLPLLVKDGIVRWVAGVSGERFGDGDEGVWAWLRRVDDDATGEGPAGGD